MPKENLYNIIKSAAERNFASFQEGFNNEMMDRLDDKFEERSANIFKPAVEE